MKESSKGKCVDENVRVQYLSMIQGIISRMGSYCVAIKTGCIALVGALFVFLSPGFQVEWHRCAFFCLPFFVVVLVCALFDAKYLQQGRCYRSYYLEVLDAEDESYDRSMKMPDSSSECKSLYRQCFFSWSIVGFYLALLFAVIASFAVVCSAW